MIKKIVKWFKDYIWNRPYRYKDGTKIWTTRNGDFHREDGPAIEYLDGSKYWYRNEKLHREDGPAVEYYDGGYSWYLNGIKYRTFEDFFEATTDEGKDKLIWEIDKY